MAARYGHLEVLQWALANGCSWNIYTCMNAAAGGYLEILQWFRAYGCPRDRWTRHVATGHILEWAIANGAPEH